MELVSRTSIKNIQVQVNQGNDRDWERVVEIPPKIQEKVMVYLSQSGI